MRARQGDVFRAQIAPKIGFGASRDGTQLVVVAQGNALNSVLETIVAVPLVPTAPGARALPLDVLVPAAELGTDRDHLAPVHLLRPIALSRLEPGPVARVSAATAGRLLAAVRRVFQ